jgi:hypothetical protein
MNVIRNTKKMYYSVLGWNRGAATTSSVGLGVRESASCQFLMA